MMRREILLNLLLCYLLHYISLKIISDYFLDRNIFNNTLVHVGLHWGDLIFIFTILRSR